MNNRNLKGNSNAGRKGKVVITGAGAGVGRATAQRFARVGACLGLIGRDQASLEQAANEVRDLGGEAVMGIADVADAAQVEATAPTGAADF